VATGCAARATSSRADFETSNTVTLAHTNQPSHTASTVSAKAQASNACREVSFVSERDVRENGLAMSVPAWPSSEMFTSLQLTTACNDIQERRAHQVPSSLLHLREAVAYSPS
jgi:hypothetical protein